MRAPNYAPIVIFFTIFYIYIHFFSPCRVDSEDDDAIHIRVFCE